MTVILKDFLNKETLSEIITRHNFIKSIYNFATQNRIVMKAASLTLIGMMAVGISIISAGITLGLKVNYCGSFIATVSNAQVFNEAKDIAVSNIEGEDAHRAIKTPSFTRTLTVTDKLDNAVKLADAIIENTGDIVETAVLVVNGEHILSADSAELKAYVEQRRTLHEIKGAENISEFIDNVELKDGYSLKSGISSTEEMKAAVDSLKVKTVSVVTTETIIPHTVKRVNSSKLPAGYSEITKKGENGLKRTVETVEIIDGTEVSRTLTSNEIVKQAVTQVTTVGTSRHTAAAGAASTERSSGFILPLKRGAFSISSYYGDGRNHKGIDLCAKKGTSIYAVASGTVVTAGWHGNYGYSVLIDHGNGLKTRYAHASALCVKAGQTVSQGDVVAYVGSTGYSTGNHLHFEVIKNGTRVNPAPYIGL